MKVLTKFWNWFLNLIGINKHQKNTNIGTNEQILKTQRQRVNHKFGRCTIPSWCWNYISPIVSSGCHWNEEKNCIVLI